ncbi:hypothetical protein [Stieleria mannarensis]|uniref:hypothetical protein n=1 Tax=Stieleria mannarensis TaxID=2755585 RepID=UPI0016003417|nr:hypothetical protein [Rhodopirellula sp. JC639]
MANNSSRLYLKAKRALSRMGASAVPGRQFIFCASTGRSGTHTLRRIFEQVPGVWAEHEPWPRCNGELLEKWNSGRADDEEFFRDQIRYYKVPRIIFRAGLAPVYLEANHQFIKSFADEAAESLGGRLKVVVLRRSPIAVAASMTGRGDVPGTDRGNVWNLKPDWPKNLIQVNELLTSERYSHAFYRCIWYCFEVEARIQRFQEKYPSVETFELETGDLNKREDVLRLAEWMGVSKKGMAHLKHSFAPRKEDASHRTPTVPEEIDIAELRSFYEGLNSRLARPLPVDLVVNELKLQQR